MKEDLNPRQALEKARYYAMLAKGGVISYERGKALCAPYLEIVNKRGEQIAKKHKRRYDPITYTALLR